jgi:predicted SAM-dependent methyltransferase
VISSEVKSSHSQSAPHAAQLGRRFGRVATRCLGYGLDAVGGVVKELIRGSWLSLGRFAYRCQGRIPWSAGYGAYRTTLIEKLITDQEFLERFQEGRDLPDGFGMRLDERVIEYPWVFTKIRKYAGRSHFLDAGSTLNHEMILKQSTIKQHKWVILTLGPESKCFWNWGVSYVYDDLRSVPLREEWFDAVFCISVIEHIGMDNLLYTPEDNYRERRPRDYLHAVDEMKRILKPKGWLYLTVPFGRYEDHGWLQQFDTGMLSELIAHFKPRGLKNTFFRYTGRGWKLATEDECSDLAYFDFHAGRFSKIKGLKRFDADFAAAARGLACVELQK